MNKIISDLQSNYILPKKTPLLNNLCSTLKLKLVGSNSKLFTVVSPVQFSHSVVSDSLRPHAHQASVSITNYTNPCPLSRWCHPAISSSVVPFSSCPQSFPALGSFPMSQLLAWGGPSIGVSASTSVLPMNTQAKFRLSSVNRNILWMTMGGKIIKNFFEILFIFFSFFNFLFSFYLFIYLLVGG